MRTPLILLGLLALLAGCSTYESFSYAPRVAEVRTALRGAPDDVEARTLATIVGVRRADDDAGLPRSVETRLRLENLSDRELRLDPAAMRLLTRDLEEIGPPIAEPAAPLQLGPGRTASITAWFPLDPDRSLDLSSLVLEWTLDLGAATTRHQSATFDRRYRHYRYHGPFWDPYWGHYYHSRGARFGVRIGW